jgi:hypothetical protein
MGLPGWPIWGESALLYGGVLLVWALALYVATRSEGGGRIPVLTVLAMVALSVYLLGQAIADIAPSVVVWARWLAATWPGAALAPALWASLALAMLVQEGPIESRTRLAGWFWPVSGILIAIGAALAVLGTSTNLVEDWSDPINLSGPLEVGTGGLPHVPDGALFPIFRIYASVCVVVALASFWSARGASEPGTPLRARFDGLLGTSVLFLLGVLELVWVSTTWGTTGLPGHLLVILGMLLFGWNIARYGALLTGEVVRADVLAYALTTVGIIVVYGGLAAILVPREFDWLARLLPILLLIMATHVLAETRGNLLDRWLFEPVVATLRGQLRLQANRVVRQPDPVTALADVQQNLADVIRAQETRVDLEPPPASDGAVSEPTAASAPTDFRLLVEGALRHLDDPPALSQHPLLAAVRLDMASPLENAAALRSELVRAVERLRPSGPRPTPGSDGRRGGWLPYLVLYEAYVETRPNKQIMQRYYVSEGTFHRTRRRAIDAVATDLYHRLLARSHDPSPGQHLTVG